MQRVADQSVAADLVAREGPLIDKNDVDAFTAQNPRRGGSGGSRADDEDVATVVRARSVLTKQAGRR